MMFCSNCGKKVLDNAFFCSECGVKTSKGVKDRISYPSSNLENELKQAFTKVGKTLEEAFKVAQENIRKSRINVTSPKKGIKCPSCSSTNPEDSKFCYDCGKEIK